MIIEGLDYITGLFVRDFVDVVVMCCTAAYVRWFRRLPRHRQSVPYSARTVLTASVTVDECARRCILSSTDRRCRGFNYKPDAQYRPCTLLHAGPGLPAVYAHDTDFYQRQPGPTPLDCLQFNTLIIMIIIIAYL